jgi:hypothetical protein
VAGKNNQAWQGRQAIRSKTFLSPRSGAWMALVDYPRFHRGLLSVAAPQLQYDFENMP